MVSERRNYQVVNNRVKKTLAIAIVLSLVLPPCCVCAAESSNNTKTAASTDNAAAKKTKKSSDVLQGSVSVDIKPYYANWNSKEAVAHINRIGSRLLDANNIDDVVMFRVSKDKSANAYANMNDIITVHIGLLQYVETEDELAYVIGHEIGHISNNHVRKGYPRKVAVIAAGVAGTTMAVLGAANNSARMTKTGAIVTGTAVAGRVADSAVSRKYEAAADAASIDYLVKAGYNPLASISMMNKLSGRYFDVLSDHPSGGKRIQKMYDYIAKNYPEYIEKGFESRSYNKALKYIKVSDKSGKTGETEKIEKEK